MYHLWSLITHSFKDFGQQGFRFPEEDFGQEDLPLGKTTYSNLDLIKADTLITPPKITKMLQQLEFKLQVEKQYKQGIDKMAKLYSADGDKKSKADAEAKKVESEKKIQLLNAALKRYKNLHILDDVIGNDETGTILVQSTVVFLLTNCVCQRCCRHWFRG